MGTWWGRVGSHEPARARVRIGQGCGRSRVGVRWEKRQEQSKGKCQSKKEKPASSDLPSVC